MQIGASTLAAGRASPTVHFTSRSSAVTALWDLDEAQPPASHTYTVSPSSHLVFHKVWVLTMLVHNNMSRWSCALVLLHMGLSFVMAALVLGDIVC